jgi:hypothetical protein
MSKYTIGVVRKEDILVPDLKDFEEMENNFNFIKKAMSKYSTGKVFSYSDFEAMKKRQRIRDRVLIFLLSLLMAFFLFKDAFALYGTTYLPNGQKAYKNMDTGQVIAPCECRCD